MVKNNLLNEGTMRKINTKVISHTKNEVLVIESTNIYRNSWRFMMCLFQQLRSRERKKKKQH